MKEQPGTSEESRRRRKAGVEERSGIEGGAGIEVCLNGEERRIPARLSVRGLLEWLDLDPGLVVVELNREILDRVRYEGVEVMEGDVLELVHFVGGGS